MTKKQVAKRGAVALPAMVVAAAAIAGEPKGFDPEEIRAATARLVAALEDPDPTAWVYRYTEDPGLLAPGGEPVQGRARLLEMARSMRPMSSVTITPSRTEGDGRIAYLFGSGSWVNGRPPDAGPTSQVYLVIVWRKEADGQWRVAQEALVPKSK